MSEPGEMEVIARLAAVDAAVFTNIGVAHIENLGSRERILEEKLHIQDGMKPGGVLFLNADNDLLQTARTRADLRVITYGLSPDADYRAEEIRLENGCASFTAVHKSGRTPVRHGRAQYCKRPGGPGCGRLFRRIPRRGGGRAFPFYRV